ncbi:MAG: 50S ribosomal protein L29 [Candidatus Margulisbacteria bacterium]|nr:50S ribosomal protein L29 [Candidatus Margulisiibacteriota bacterium]
MSKKKADTTKMTEETMLKTINDKKKEMINGRFQLVANQLKDVKMFQKNRKEIARLYTALNQMKKGDK